MSIHVTSRAFPAGNEIPKRYTGDGDNVSPPLVWQNLPAGTQEIAVLVEDPDAPTPEPYVHWVAHKLPAELMGLDEDARGIGLQGKNSFAHTRYDGPAPPRGHGRHRYFFHVYALDVLLPDERLDKAGLLAAMAGHVLDEGQLMGTYERP